MYNRKWIVPVTMALLMGILLLIAFSKSFFFSDIFEPDSMQAAKYRFAFVCGDTIETSKYWRECADGIETAAAERGVSVSFMDGSVIDGYSSMKDAFDSAVLSQMDGVICVGFAPEDLKACIDQAISQGVPTICVDGDVAQSARIAYVGTDNYAAGAKAAERMLELTNGGCVHVIYPNYVTPQFAERAKGFSERLSLESGYTLCVHETIPSQQQLIDYNSFVLSILEQHPETIGLFCPGTSANISGIARSLESMRLDEQISIVCFDDYDAILERIEGGGIDATVVQQPYEMGLRAVRLLCDYVESGCVENEIVYVDTYYIDRANIGQYREAGDAA